MKVEFIYTDVDNSLYTHAQASVVMEIHADDLVTAHILAEKLMIKLGADRYVLDEPTETTNRDLTKALDKANARIATLEKENTDMGWQLNPDRMGGGGFTAEEMDPNRGWK